MPQNNPISQSGSQYISATIQERISNYGTDYAVVNAPRSPHPELTQNKHPNISRLSWLKQRSKCNQFIGDVLTILGLRMPTYTMTDGSKHYVNAEALPKFKNHFSILTNINSLRAGDVLVFDNLKKSGENGAHVQIVSSRKESVLLLAGAGSKGAVLKDFLISKLGPKDKNSSSFTNGSTRTWLLRPKQLL